MDNKLQILAGNLNLILNNVGKIKTVDDSGIESYTDVKIFSDDQLFAYINLALPVVIALLARKQKLADENLIGTFTVQYAAYMALFSNSLLEKGRECSIANNGSNLADHLFTVAQNIFNNLLRTIEAM